MSRIIKFRAWDDRTKEMFTNFPKHGQKIGLMTPSPYLDQEGQLIKYNTYHLMQFTGLLDKNGKEIYKGDICRYAVFDREDSDTHFIGVVNWLGTEFIITQIPDTFSNGEYGLGLAWVHNQYSEMEIIGNIYENPELLHD